MRSVRFDRLLAGTALGLVLAFSSHAVRAQSDEAKIESAMPMLEYGGLAAADGKGHRTGQPVPPHRNRLR